MPTSNDKRLIEEVARMGANYDNLKEIVTNANEKTDKKIDSLQDSLDDIKEILRNTVSVEHFNNAVEGHSKKLDEHDDRLSKLEERNAREDDGFVRSVSRGLKNKAVAVTVSVVFLVIMLMGYWTVSSMIRQSEESNKKIDFLESEIIKTLSK